MKVRLTIMTENNRPRPSGVTEEKLAKVWQTIFDTMALFSENDDDKATVEKVEFIDD